MISSIKIHNYKSLNELSVAGFNQLNLILGGNNTGKSSLLEAIYLYSNSGNFSSIRNILEERGYNITRYVRNNEYKDSIIDAYASLIYGRSLYTFYKEGIRISDDQNRLSLQFADVLREYQDIDNSSVRKVRIYDDNEDESLMGENPALIVKKNGKTLDLQPLGTPSHGIDRNKALPKSVFVRTTNMNGVNNANMFDQITMTFYEPELIKALQVVDPQIVAINFIRDPLAGTNRLEERVPYVKLQNGERYKLSSMGDGINHILTIILSLLNCEDGVLLVDEFENGLHYSVQTQLWRMIKELAINLKVQVFITTHSNDCIKSFIESEAYEIGRIVKLEKHDGNINVVPFNSYERVAFALDNNIDIR